MLTLSQLRSELTANLHGSGWNGEWKVSSGTGGRWFIEIDYQLMNENGFYDGWITVKATVDAKTLELKRLVFPGTCSYHRRKYLSMDTEYYYAAIEDALQSIHARYWKN